MGVEILEEHHACADSIWCEKGLLRFRVSGFEFRVPAKILKHRKREILISNPAPPGPSSPTYQRKVSG
jgi:hypothetical protein